MASNTETENQITAQSTGYPAWILKVRQVKSTSENFLDQDIINRTPTIKDFETGQRYTKKELSWENDLPNYRPVPISDGTNDTENNDLFLDQGYLTKVLAGQIKFEGYADPPLVDGKLPERLQKELQNGVANRYKITDEKQVVKVKVNRRSHTGKIQFDSQTGLPLNPLGRTGLIGRGFLGRWGPNHAADCLVFRFKKDSKTGKERLQAALAYRARDGKWSIPGGMVDFDENAIRSLLRELDEETGLKLLDQLNDYFFSENPREGDSLFEDLEGLTSWIATKRQVDDNRNTDCSWMETLAAIVILDEKLGQEMTKFDVQDTEEIGTACWVDITADLLSGTVEHSVQAGGQTHSGTIWASHVTLLNDLVQQVVQRGYAKLDQDGDYVKT